MSGDFRSGGSPTGPGAGPAGGPPGGGQRPAGSNSEPADDASSDARDEQFASRDAVDAEDAERDGATSEGGADPEAESAGRFPAEPGRRNDSPSDPDAPTAGSGEFESDAVARERDEYRDALVRLQADFENYKKRMLKQQTEHLERAATALVEKLLPVLDTADLALAHGGGEDLKQLTGSLVGALEKEGLERIAGEGAPFDPTLHDAVAHEPGDGDGEQVVVEVLRAGYRWKGRVLRPAMVKVRG